MPELTVVRHFDQVVTVWGSNAYNMRHTDRSGMYFWLNHFESEDAYPKKTRGEAVGSQREDGSVDCSAFLEYFQEKPWRRTTFVLDARTGQEKEVPPLIWAADDGAANRPPPVVGGDGRLWQQHRPPDAKPLVGQSLSHGVNGGRIGGKTVDKKAPGLGDPGQDVGVGATELNT